MRFFAMVQRGPQIDKLHRKRQEIEFLRSQGATHDDISEKFGVSPTTVSSALRAWGYIGYARGAGGGILPAGEVKKPKLPSFRFERGEEYRIGNEEYIFLEHISCATGDLFIFRAPQGWKSTFTIPQLVGQEVKQARARQEKTDEGKVRNG